MLDLNIVTAREDGVSRPRDVNLSLPSASDFWKDCPLDVIIQDPSFGLIREDHFTHFTTAHEGWTSVLTDSGTATIAAATSAYLGGCVAIVASDETIVNNDEAYIGLANKSFILAAGKDLWFEAAVKFTEASTNVANIIAGLASTYAAETLQNDGVGPPDNYDGIVFFKVDGGTVWQAESSATTTQQTSSSVGTRVSGSWTRLGFKVSGVTKIDFYVNGALVTTHATTLPTAAMGIIFGVKNGSASTETLYVDYVRAVQFTRQAIGY
jgi:hypothetical protein